jgi:serine/threonine protein kinase
MDEALGVNSTISHYRIISKIGSGGSREVYLAEDTCLYGEIALKFLPPKAVSDKERMRRFDQETIAPRRNSSQILPAIMNRRSFSPATVNRSRHRLKHGRAMSS